MGGRHEPMVSFEVNMKKVQNVAELATHLASLRAVTFLEVEWSSTAVIAGRQLRSVVDAHTTELGAVGVALADVDVSSQRGDVWDFIDAWLRDRGTRPGPLLFGGHGSILWSRGGRLVDHVVDGYSQTADGIWARTANLCAGADLGA
jgi:hypothetical protein